MNTMEPHHERVASGIAGLDTLLSGGFFKGGVYIIQGPPGAGKTVLGNQLCFNHVAAGHRAVYVTLLAETHARMMLNIRSFGFYDGTRVPESIYYMSAFRTLEEEGLRGLLELLRREVRGRGATILLLDGLVSAEESAESPRDFKKFIHELQNQATLLDCTTFLLTSGGVGRGVRAEHTMVDGLLELGDEMRVVRSERFIHVAKFRGGRHLRGRHAFEITDDGIIVHPRIEALLAEPTSVGRVPRATHTSGVAGIDSMFLGGLSAGSASVAVGPSGIGKTTFGLQFIAASRAHEKGVFFGFYETPAALTAKAEALGIDLEAKVKAGHVEVLWQPPTEAILDAVGARLVDTVRRTGAKRVLVDSLGAFAGISFYPERAVPFFAAIANELRALGVTSVWTYETPQLVSPEIPAPLHGISPVVDNALVLRFVEIDSRLHRLVSIMKKRSGAFDAALRSFTIDDHGLHIGDEFHSVEALLTGAAHKVAKSTRAPAKPTEAVVRKKGRRARR
jgi:circadian clock protein KaiC